MSQNTDTVQAIYQAFGSGDVAAILARLAPNVEWEHDWGGKQLKWYKSRSGRESVAGFFKDIADFEFNRFEPVAFLEGSNMVAVPIHLDVVLKANRRRIKDLEVHLWTFGGDGLVTRMRHVVDTWQFAEALQG